MTEYARGAAIPAPGVQPQETWRDILPVLGVAAAEKPANGIAAAARIKTCRAGKRMIQADRCQTRVDFRKSAGNQDPRRDKRTLNLRGMPVTARLQDGAWRGSASSALE